MKEGVGIRGKYKTVIVLVMMLFFALLGGCKSKETKIANDYEEKEKSELSSQENVKKEEHAEEVISQREKQNNETEEQSVTQAEEQKQAMTEDPKENKVKEQHSHIWLPISKTVIHEATGHYETKVVEEVYAWRTFCNKCGEDITDLGVEGITIHSAVLCESGYHNDYVVVETKTDQVWIEDTPAHAETIIEGYYCDCGATKTK